MLILASYTFGQALLTVLEFALLFLWIWVAVAVLIDVFRSHDLSGWAKAAWLLFIVVVPLVGVLVYLIARGHEMAEHRMRDEREQEAAARTYIREAASTPADDIAKLDDLRSRGVITEQEFRDAKQKALS